MKPDKQGRRRRAKSHKRVKQLSKKAAAIQESEAILRAFQLGSTMSMLVRAACVCCCGHLADHARAELGDVVAGHSALVCDG